MPNSDGTEAFSPFDDLEVKTLEQSVEEAEYRMDRSDTIGGIPLETIEEARDILDANDQPDSDVVDWQNAMTGRGYPAYNTVPEQPPVPQAGSISDSYSLSGDSQGEPDPPCFFCGSEEQGIVCKLSEKLGKAKMSICPDCFWGAISTVMQNARSK